MRMDREQTKAVLAHEIEHIKNGDMVTLALMQGVLNTFVIFFARVIGYVVDKTVFKIEKGNGIASLVVAIVAEILLGIFASVVVMWFSRRGNSRCRCCRACWKRCHDQCTQGNTGIIRTACDAETTRRLWHFRHEKKRDSLHFCYAS